MCFSLNKVYIPKYPDLSNNPHQLHHFKIYLGLGKMGTTVGLAIPSAILGCGVLYLRIIKSTKIISLHKCNHQHRDNTHGTNSSDKMECTNMNQLN